MLEQFHHALRTIYPGSDTPRQSGRRVAVRCASTRQRDSRSAQDDQQRPPLTNETTKIGDRVAISIAFGGGHRATMVITTDSERGRIQVKLFDVPIPRAEL